MAGSGEGSARITLVGRPGCHLCDTARDVVARVAAESGAGWTERNIDVDADLHDRYWDRIPVVLIDGAEHAAYWVEEDRLRAALGAVSPD